MQVPFAMRETTYATIDGDLVDEEVADEDEDEDQDGEGERLGYRHNAVGAV